MTELRQRIRRTSRLLVILSLGIWPILTLLALGTSRAGDEAAARARFIDRLTVPGAPKRPGLDEFAALARAKGDLLAQAELVVGDPDVRSRPAAAQAEPLAPHSAEISGPRIMVVGEAIHLVVEESSAEFVKNRIWHFNPEPSWKLFNGDRSEVWFGSSETGPFDVSLTSIRLDYAGADAAWRVELIAKPGRGGPDSGMNAPLEDTPAVRIARWVSEVVVPDRPRDAREIGSALTRATQGADRGLLSPYTVLNEGKAMAAVALKTAGGSIEPWLPFFAHLDDLFGEFEESGEFRDPRRRTLAVKAIAAVLMRVDQ